MKIGITERGDAGLDLKWYGNMINQKVDGVVLITKNITQTFADRVMHVQELGIPVILHCTCTGWGCSPLEPNAPNPKMQLINLNRLIKMGFPIERCVLRIDPIFPNKLGLTRVKEVLGYAQELKLLPDIRVRISVYDEYPHVRERLKDLCLRPMYDGQFQAPKEMLDDVIKTLAPYGIKFECCAEDYLCDKRPDVFVRQGCISEKDLKLMGLTPESYSENPQNRKGCHCLSCKTELLTQNRQCPHKCAYCYWRN